MGIGRILYIKTMEILTSKKYYKYVMAILISILLFCVANILYNAYEQWEDYENNYDDNTDITINAVIKPHEPDFSNYTKLNNSDVLIYSTYNRSMYSLALVKDYSIIYRNIHISVFEFDNNSDLSYTIWGDGFKMIDVVNVPDNKHKISYYIPEDYNYFSYLYVLIESSKEYVCYDYVRILSPMKYTEEWCYGKERK